MIGLRVELKGLCTPGWTDERGRIIGKQHNKLHRFIQLRACGRVCVCVKLIDFTS
jgi:hypothetical protein